MGRARLTVRVAGLSALPPGARKPALFERAVKAAYAAERAPASGEIAVVFLGRARMLALNKRYLGHDWDTDVITFQHERVPGIPTEELPLGDIYVSAWLVRRQAAEQGHGVLAEALTMVAHGALHLLGHDDSKPRPKARMFAAQDRIVAGLTA